MKKLIVLFLSCLMLSGCAGTPSGSSSTPASTTSIVPTSSTVTAPSTPGYSMPSGPITFLVYAPDDDWTNFATYEMTIPELDPDMVLQLLYEYGAISRKVYTNTAEVTGSCLHLDLSEDFYLELLTMGSTGEKFLIGSVVNSFISAYGVETVMITANQQIMDSGHVIYDFPLGFFE